MKTIRFDGSKLFTIKRNANGQIDICISPNHIGIPNGETRDLYEFEIPKDADCVLELPNNNTYINLCRVLLSFATREELVQIVGNPMSCANYTTTERKKKGEK